MFFQQNEHAGENTGIFMLLNTHEFENVSIFFQ